MARARPRCPGGAGPLPEGIAYDPAQEAFYLHEHPQAKNRGTGQSRNRDGLHRPGARTGSSSGLGAAVDASRRILWVCTADRPRMEGHNEGTAGLSGIFRYDLTSRKLLKKYVMDRKTGPHLLNDLAVTSQGVVFATDSLAGAVYRISPEQDDLPSPDPLRALRISQRHRPFSDETTLFVAHASGIETVNLKTGDRGNFSTGPRCSSEGSTACTFSGKPHRHTKQRPQGGAPRAEQDFGQGGPSGGSGGPQPLFAGMPTTGTLVGDTLYYIANSQLNAAGRTASFPGGQTEGTGRVEGAHRVLRLPQEQAGRFIREGRNKNWMGESMAARKLESLWKTEDWWSVWMGLGLVLVALTTFWAGGSIKGWAVIPARWSNLPAAGRDLAAHAWGYGVIFVLFAATFAVSMAVMGRNVSPLSRRVRAPLPRVLGPFYLAGWKVMEEWNLEAPLLALIAGLLISNVIQIPEWCKDCLCTEVLHQGRHRPSGGDASPHPDPHGRARGCSCRPPSSP